MTFNQILVAGATGRTGRIIVQKLLQRGLTPHVLARDLDAAQNRFGDDVIYHQGDVRALPTLLTAMTGMDAVISAIGSRAPVGSNCPKHVDYEGVANLIQAATFQQVMRFILISSIAVTHPEHPLNQFGKVLDWKLSGEQVLQESSLDYTIIRPGGLKDTPGGQNQLMVDQGDRIIGTISRADVAEVCLHALQYPECKSSTFEVIESDHKGQVDWTRLCASISPD